MTDQVEVLDHGYVRLVGVLGDDLTPVNAARVSFDKESDWDYRMKSSGEPPAIYPLDTRWPDLYDKRLKTKDKKLLHYLAEHGHHSPFRHAVLSFEVYAPLMVMRQWGKYRVGSTWVFEDSDDPLEAHNESSRRYITEEPKFYIPTEWRSAPENKKQGSGPPVDEVWVGDWADREMQDSVSRGYMKYSLALERGICAEQARLFLPYAAMYIRARWTVSLQGVIHFLQQRLHEDAQVEIRLFSEAVRDLVKPRFPESLEAFGL